MTTKNTILGFEVPVIGVVHSCFQEKFAVPRQSGLVPCASARIEMLPPYNTPDAFDGLELCSHIWLQFIFHKNLDNNKRKPEFRPKVRPPRLGGNDAMGVFATRSPFRPSALGLSVVKLEKINISQGVVLHITGADLVDKTPVVDIKPYVPYADCLPGAVNHFADAPPAVMPINFCPKFRQKLALCQDSQYLGELIQQVLQLDPRPSYQKTDSERVYGAQIAGYDVRWRYTENNRGECIEVLDLIDPLAIKPQLP